MYAHTYMCLTRMHTPSPSHTQPHVYVHTDYCHVPSQPLTCVHTPRSLMHTHSASHICTALTRATHTCLTHVCIHPHHNTRPRAHAHPLLLQYTLYAHACSCTPSHTEPHAHTHVPIHSHILSSQMHSYTCMCSHTLTHTYTHTHSSITKDLGCKVHQGRGQRTKTHLTSAEPSQAPQSAAFPCLLSGPSPTLKIFLPI